MLLKGKKANDVLGGKTETKKEGETIDENNENQD